MNLIKYLLPAQIIDLKATTKDAALDEMCNIAALSPEITAPERFHADILARERVMSTGIGTGIAIPHAKSSAATGFVIAIGRCREGLDFESLDGLPVQLIVLLGAPERKQKEFLKLMAKIGELFNNADFRHRFMEAGTSKDMYRLFRDNSE